MITLLFMAQIASWEPVTTIKDKTCPNTPIAIFKLSERILCVPTDLIFKGDFSEANENVDQMEREQEGK